MENKEKSILYSCYPLSMVVVDTDLARGDAVLARVVKLMMDRIIKLLATRTYG